MSRNGVKVGMGAALAAGALLLAAPGAASAVTLTEFNLPGTADEGAATAITSAGGALWAAAPGGIYRINPVDGSATLIGDGANVPFAITTGPDGRAWFGEQDDDGNGAVGAVNLDNTINRFPGGISQQPAVIEDIAPGFPPSRFLWFTEQGEDIIGRLDTSDDSIDEFQTLLNGSGSVEGIAAGPDGGIWFTESEDPGAIARLDPSSPTDDPHVDEFDSSNGLTPNSEPNDIIVGPDGALWFSQDNAIGSISPVSGAITEHAVPADAQPEQLVVGPDGAIWFTDLNGQIGRMDPISGNVQEFGDAATAAGSPEGITVGSDGNIWFTLPDTDQVGRLQLTTATPTPTPTATPTPTPTPTTPPPPTGPAGDTTAPVISGLALSARCVRTGSGMTARFKLSENARVLYSIRRRVGSPVRRRCPATQPHQHGPAGSSVQVGLKTADGHAGDNVATLARVRRGRSAVARARRGHNRARLARLVRGLRPGTYQLVVRATDAAGNVSRDRIVRFWVLRR